GGVDRGASGAVAVGAGALEAGELQLGGDARRCRGLDQGAALRLDAGRGIRLGTVDLGPDPSGIWIEPEDDLRGALRDRRSETISEALRQAQLLCLIGLDGLLEAGAGLEARDPGSGDLHTLAGLGVAALTRTTLGHAELAEPGERDLAPSLQGVLDGVKHGVDGVGRLLLAQAGAVRHLVHEFGLRHVLHPPWVGVGRT